MIRIVSTMVGVAFVATVIGGILGRHLVLQRVPLKAMEQIQTRIVNAVGDWNQCLHNRTYGPSYGTVERANADNMGSAMAYDLSGGPVRLSGVTWPNYWSLSVYQQNTDNIFVVNDAQLESDNFDFTLSLSADETIPRGSTRIVSPTKKGIVLIRRFAPNSEAEEAIRENQAQMNCAPLKHFDGFGGDIRKHSELD